MTGALRVSATTDELAAAAADEIVDRLRAGVQTQGRFSLVLAGGSTPLALYRKLAERADDPLVPWGSVEWFWGDERAVPPDHPESNFGAAWKALLSKLPIAPERIHRIEGERNPDEAAARYEAELRRTLALTEDGFPRFDLILLGLGADGHTASLFPGSSALVESRRAVVSTWVEELNSRRVTLTYPAINAAATVLFLVTGEEKATVLKQVLQGQLEPSRLPAQGVQPDNGELLWWMDQAAGKTALASLR